jgi:hypothetical protein
MREAPLCSAEGQNAAGAWDRSIIPFGIEFPDRLICEFCVKYQQLV